MKNCPKCKYDVPNGVNYCPACGCSMTEKPDEFTEKMNDFSDKIKDLNNTDDFSGEFTSEDIQKAKGLSILAYIPLLFIVPLIALPDSKFARFHANQGLIFFILCVIVNALSWVFLFIPFLGTLLFSALGLSLFVIMIIGIINAANGKAKELPVIGKIRILN